MPINDPTCEQKLILEYDGNIAVAAGPGSGKTYILVEKIARILPSIPDYNLNFLTNFTPYLYKK